MKRNMPAKGVPGRVPVVPTGRYRDDVAVCISTIVPDVAAAVDPIEIADGIYATVVALPEEVIGPVRFAFVVTVAALPPMLSAVAVPVRLVATPEIGVPKAGPVKVGDVPKTNAPVPVAPVDVTPSIVGWPVMVGATLITKVVPVPV